MSATNDPADGAKADAAAAAEVEAAKDDESGPARPLDGFWSGLVFVYCVALSALHLWLVLDPGLLQLKQALQSMAPWVEFQFTEKDRNIFHFAGFALLCAVVAPITTGSWARESRISFAIDVALGLAVVWGAVHLALVEDAVFQRQAANQPQLETLDWIAAAVVVIGAIELTRRSAGLVIPVLAVIALTYPVRDYGWGPEIEGVFRTAGLGLENLTVRSIYGDDAIFGTLAAISANTVFLFIIFGAFLLRSGAGDFVVDLARALAGRLIGGPGLVAVIASALTGTISGSAVANTASTGVITIPLMKRAGFPPRFAGGVEASASTGGQLMPPIMGAGAFVMAANTQIAYETIVAVALLPALLYFASVAFFVRIEARKQGLQPTPYDGPSLGVIVRRNGASFILPIIVLISLLVSGFTASYAAVIGIVSVIASSWLTTTPMGPRLVLSALALGARNMVMTAVLLCTVGLIVNIILLAGVGNTFSLMISEWSGGNLLIAITLVAVASLVLGMGLPVTAAYIVLATLSAPALAGMISDGFAAQAIAEGALAAQIASGALDPAFTATFALMAPEAFAQITQPLTLSEAQTLIHGLPLELQQAIREAVLDPAVLTTALLSAHMIVFWLSQDSNVTPPVALAAFTAAAIAKAPAMSTGFFSWKIAKGLYIVPLLFAYTPFLSGDPVTALSIFVLAFVGVYGLAAGIEGWMEHKLPILLRAVAFVAGAACLWPGSLALNVLGAALVLALAVWSAGHARRLDAEAA